MKNFDFHMPTLEDRRIIEERAHQLRAEAIRISFSQFVQFVSSLPHRVVGVFRKVAHH